MKIALLNLPFDNNYGGNLQRYALMKVLEDMGHEVTHIFQRISRQLPFYRWPLVLAKRVIKKYILQSECLIFWEQHYNRTENEKADLALPFYEKYIKHTTPVKNVSDLKKITKKNFDAYIVGSDQVWREDMTNQLGIENYFLSFVRNPTVKKIAYAVSLGTDYNTFSPSNIKRLSELYTMFCAVSYRETSARHIFESNGWVSPKPQLVLDPTLLLEVNDYKKIITENKTSALTSNKIYCYILDQNDHVKSIILEKKNYLHLEVIMDGLNKQSNPTTIPQWLNNIKNAEYVITDSYHGSIFSIIFRKPFLFLGNKRRGNARIDSLFSILNIEKKDNDFIICNNSVYEKINELRQKSLIFLNRSLE